LLLQGCRRQPASYQFGAGGGHFAAFREEYRAGDLAAINCSTNLPSMSVSRLTALPTVRSLRAVTSRVWGMIQMSKLFRLTAATVRLMPSTAMEPLKTT